MPIASKGKPIEEDIQEIDVETSEEQKVTGEQPEVWQREKPKKKKKPKRPAAPEAP